MNSWRGFTKGFTKVQTGIIEQEWDGWSTNTLPGAESAVACSAYTLTCFAYTQNGWRSLIVRMYRTEVYSAASAILPLNPSKTMTKHFRFSGTNFANRVDRHLGVCRSTQSWTPDATKPPTCSAPRTPTPSFVLSPRGKERHRSAGGNATRKATSWTDAFAKEKSCKNASWGNAARPNKTLKDS